MIRKINFSLVALLSLVSCTNAVGPNASDPYDPAHESAAKEEYFDPSTASTADESSTTID